MFFQIKGPLTFNVHKYMIDRNDYNTVKQYIAGFVFIPKCIVLGIFNDFRPLSN